MTNVTAFTREDFVEAYGEDFVSASENHHGFSIAGKVMLCCAKLPKKGDPVYVISTGYRGHEDPKLSETQVEQVNLKFSCGGSVEIFCAFLERDNLYGATINGSGRRRESGKDAMYVGKNGDNTWAAFGRDAALERLNSLLASYTATFNRKVAAIDCIKEAISSPALTAEALPA